MALERRDLRAAGLKRSCSIISRRIHPGPIAFGRRLNAVMEQMFLTAVWRNFVKKRTERLARSGTPAMHLGLAREPGGTSIVASGPVRSTKPTPGID